jgi:hypothetical protein
MAKHDPIPRPAGYWLRSQRPLQALIFLAPLILLYDIALPQIDHNTSDIFARLLLYRFFEYLGIMIHYLPGMILIAILLCWHKAKHDPWRFEPKVYGLMWVETLVLAIPLLVFQMVLYRQGILKAQAGGEAAAGAVMNVKAELIFAIGAGIYEELLFRLIAMTLLHILMVDLLKSSEKVAMPFVIAIPAVLFSLHHFMGDTAFTWGRFTFYTGAGLYFAFVFLARGFGIVAGVHAMHNMLVVALLYLLQHRG